MIAFDDGGPVARFSAAGAVGGLPALQGSSGGYQLGIKALMAANPGMTLAQATRLLLGPAGAVATGGLMATQALMATDKGVGQDAAMGSGYDYGPEIMAGGQPDIPVEVTGPRGESLLLPRQQAMDPVTNKYVDVPPSARSPGLAGVLDNGTAPVAAEPTTPAAPVAAPASKKDPSEIALVTQAGQKLLPKEGLSVADFKARQKEFGITDNVDADLKKQIEDLAAGSKGDREQAKYMAMLQAGLGIMGGTSPYALQNISAGALKGVERYAGDIKDIKKEERDLVKLRGELARAEDARKRGDFKTFEEANDRAQKLKIDMMQAQSGRILAEASQTRAKAAGSGITLNQMATLRMNAEKEIDPNAVRAVVAKDKKLSKTPKPGENKKFDEDVAAAYEAEIEKRVARALGGSARSGGGATKDLSGYRIVPEDGE
jgi:hypothetical protein